jgi:hypothetical protein
MRLSKRSITTSVTAVETENQGLRYGNTKFKHSVYPVEFRSIKIFDCTNMLFSTVGFASNWKK